MVRSWRLLTPAVFGPPCRPRLERLEDRQALSAAAFPNSAVPHFLPADPNSTLFAIQGSPWTGPVAQFAAADPTTVRAAIHWGDQASSSATIVPHAGGGLVVGTHTYTSVGSFTLTVTLEQAAAPVDVTTRTVLVGPPPGGAGQPPPPAGKPPPPKELPKQLPRDMARALDPDEPRPPTSPRPEPAPPHTDASSQLAWSRLPEHNPLRVPPAESRRVVLRVSAKPERDIEAPIVQAEPPALDPPLATGHDTARPAEAPAKDPAPVAIARASRRSDALFIPARAAPAMPQAVLVPLPESEEALAAPLLDEAALLCLAQERVKAGSEHTREEDSGVSRQRVLLGVLVMWMIVQAGLDAHSSAR